MAVEFTLMHREIKVADVEMDSFYHIKSIKNIYAAAHMPVGTMQKQDADQQALAKWWSRRTIPKGRTRLQEVLDIRNMLTSKELLKDIMVGDIPVFGRERPNYQEPKVIETEDSDTDSDEGTEAVASKPSTPKPRKKREETSTYKERYLVNIPASNRSHVYINREVADCIKRVLPVIAPDMSVSGYISNILVEHLQQHWDEINELYNKEYYKPLKPF